MFVYLTRIVWLVAQPLALALILLLAALVLAAFRRPRLAGAASVLSAIVLGLSAFTTLGYVLIGTLESRFERPAEPARIDGIVVLGGGMDGEVNSARHGWELNRSGDRMVETLRLALRHPEARIVIAGGPAALAPQQEAESVAGRRFFEAFGIAAERVAIDDMSRNTEENVAFAKQLAGGGDTQTWLLVTSAFHMPRAIGLFRRAQFQVVPWPADYLASGEEPLSIKLDQSTENVSVATLALREWAGLVGYYLTGRIDEMLPGP